MARNDSRAACPASDGLVCRDGRLGAGGAQPAHQPLGAAGEAAAVQAERVGHLGGRRLVDEHREQREVVGLHPVGRGVQLVRVQRRQRRPAARHDAHGLEQLGRLGGLVDEAGRAGHAREQRKRRIGVRRVDDHPWRGVERAKAAGQRQAVPVEQVVLHQHHVRPLTRDEVCTVMRPCGRAHRNQPRLRAQQHREAGPGGGLGIDDDDARHVLHPSIGK